MTSYETSPAQFYKCTSAIEIASLKFFSIFLYYKSPASLIQRDMEYFLNDNDFSCCCYEFKALVELRLLNVPPTLPHQHHGRESEPPLLADALPVATLPTLLPHPSAQEPFPLMVLCCCLGAGAAAEAHCFSFTFLVSPCTADPAVPLALTAFLSEAKLCLLV